MMIPARVLTLTLTQSVFDLNNPDFLHILHIIVYFPITFLRALPWPLRSMASTLQVTLLAMAVCNTEKHQDYYS